MSWKEIYEKWKNFDELDASVRQELTAMENDEEAIREAFYKEATLCPQ